mmetsp:Transcript_9119/g.13441  ORF Transcript_9119/g.13441 Transcript_9119/m.13441 type:complete len:200 (+) Transcript_9119:206-805(+)
MSVHWLAFGLRLERALDDLSNLDFKRAAVHRGCAVRFVGDGRVPMFCTDTVSNETYVAVVFGSGSKMESSRKTIRRNICEAVVLTVCGSKLGRLSPNMLATFRSIGGAIGRLAHLEVAVPVSRFAVATELRGRVRNIPHVVREVDLIVECGGADERRTRCCVGNGNLECKCCCISTRWLDVGHFSPLISISKSEPIEIF